MPSGVKYVNPGIQPTTFFEDVKRVKYEVPAKSTDIKDVTFQKERQGVGRHASSIRISDPFVPWTLHLLPFMGNKRWTEELIKDCALFIECSRRLMVRAKTDSKLVMGVGLPQLHSMIHFQRLANPEQCTPEYFAQVCFFYQKNLTAELWD